MTKGEREKRVVGYVRVSTDKQDWERQKSDINNFAQKNKMLVNEFVNEVISSRKKDREIFSLIDNLKSGDILIVTELSRLGRSMSEVNKISIQAREQGLKIMIASDSSFVKVIDDSPVSQLLVSMLAFTAQLERDYISERTKSALRQRKKDGVILGRPKGSNVMKGKEEQLKKYLKMGINKSAISKLLEVSRGSLYKYLEENKL